LKKLALEHVRIYALARTSRPAPLPRVLMYSPRKLADDPYLYMFEQTVRLSTCSVVSLFSIIHHLMLFGAGRSSSTASPFGSWWLSAE
jgi:hypothetical protein